MRSGLWRHALSYIVAIVATTAALGLTRALPDALSRPFFLFFVAAAGLSAWLGGWGPGLLSTALGGAAFWFLLQHGGQLGNNSAVYELRLGLFAASSVFIVWLFAALRATQNELQTQRERFRRAQRSASIGAYDWNIQSGEILWSEELPVLKGLVSDTKFDSWQKFIHEDDRPPVHQAVERAIAAGGEMQVDFRVVRPEGTEHWVSARGQVFRDNSGKPTHLLGVVAEISDRKAAETRLELQHAITRALSESPTPALALPRVLRIIGELLQWDFGQLWLADSATGVLRWSAAWSRDTANDRQAGRPLRDRTLSRGAGLPGRVWASAQPVWMEDAAGEAGWVRDRAVAQGLRAGFAYPILLGSQVLGVFEFYSRRPHQRDEKLLEVLADMGAQIGEFVERRRAREALRDAEERYRTTLSSIGDAVIATDAHGRIQFINSVAQELTSCPPQQCEGRYLRDVFRIVREKDHQPVEDPAQRVLQTGAVVGMDPEMLLLTRDGKEIPIDDSAAPIRDDQGKLIGVVLVFRDARARRRSEEALRASEKLAATGRLAASIAHEINNPMESVSNLLYLLEHDPALDQTGRRYAQLAQQELGRMEKIVKQTLGFYREAAMPVPVRISDVLDNVLELYSRRIAKLEVEVRKHYRFNGEITAFPGEMRQVFSNLLVNALDAVGQDGIISLHVTCTRDWLYPDQEGVRVSVADNGPGILPEHIRHIFEPFFTTKGEAGTGLGLWVTHGLVQKHGGRIRVRSRTGPGRQGTCFSVFLPGQPVTVERISPPLKTAA